MTNILSFFLSEISKKFLRAENPFQKPLFIRLFERKIKIIVDEIGKIW